MFPIGKWLRYCILEAAHATLFASVLVSLVSILHINTATHGAFLFIFVCLICVNFIKGLGPKQTEKDVSLASMDPTHI